MVDIARGLMENFIILEDIFGVKIIKLNMAFKRIETTKIKDDLK